MVASDEENDRLQAKKLPLSSTHCLEESDQCPDKDRLVRSTPLLNSPYGQPEGDRESYEKEGLYSSHGNQWDRPTSAHSLTSRTYSGFRNRPVSRDVAWAVNMNPNNNNDEDAESCRKGRCGRDSVDDEGGISFLSVPNVPLRRPSTADVVIEKLHVERNEGGGLLISGVALSPHCHLTLIICGAFCLLAGMVLTYVAFGPANNPDQTVASSAALRAPPPSTISPAAAETFEAEFQVPKFLENSAAQTGALTQEVQKGNGETEQISNASSHKKLGHPSKNLRIIGPICIATGFLMIVVGISFCALGRKIQRDERESSRLESEAQLDQIRRSFSIPSDSPTRVHAPTPHQALPVMSLRRSSWWMDPVSFDAVSPPPPLSPCTTASTPHSALSSRGPSPSAGSRPGTGHYAMPVWAPPERRDVASFPPDDLVPPSKLKRVSMNAPDEARTVEEVAGGNSFTETFKFRTEMNYGDLTRAETSPPIFGGSSIVADGAVSPQPGQRNASLQRSNVARRTSVVAVADHNMPFQVPVIQVTPSSCSSSAAQSVAASPRPASDRALDM